MKKVLALIFLFNFLFLIFSCNNDETSSVSSSGVTDLYRTAVGRLFYTKLDEFTQDIEVCDISLTYNENNNNVKLKLNNCQERLMMVDLLLVDEEIMKNNDEESIVNGINIIFPHVGLEFSEDFINVVPNNEEGLHELELNYQVNDKIPPFLILFSYFEDTEGFNKRIEHYIRITPERVQRIGD